ncbi:MAG: hypothetical protein LBH25_09560 [Fibromonadaceae bacterium]|nr:hypothetical protein [Fibromonadaceae bacterium]
MIGKISENDLQNALSLLGGKLGWSEKDPERRFYLQNVIVGKVSETPSKDERGELFYFLEPWRPQNA